MNDERWQRTKALFQEVVELPAAERAAFLASAAGDDSEVRREVESLLAGDAPRGDSVGTAAYTLTSRTRRGRARIGKRSGQLQRTLLGRFVRNYLARRVRCHGKGVPRAGREVASRCRPENSAASFRLRSRPPRAVHTRSAGARLPEASEHRQHLRHRRCQRPARARAGADRRTDARGTSRSGPLPLGEALAIAAQIAAAIEAAHEKDIIHRDLKPANIKTDGAGAVKVLDFGLAKAVSPDAKGPDLTSSHEGLILGTASYMSPEQARGRQIDKRSDIWAFGCVLYEILAGRLAFPGDTVSDTIAKILEREPDWSLLPASTPPTIQHVVRRCLAKDPRQRLRDIGDARIEIESARDVLTNAGAHRPAAAIGVIQATTWLTWIAVAVLIAGVATWAARRPVQQMERPLANARFMLLTNWDGTEEGAEISADGKFVAFLADRDGEFDVWLNQIGTGHFTNLTRQVPPLLPLGSIVRKLGFSGDAADIWFNPGAHQPLVLMPLTGGGPRPFLPPGVNTPAWSPDGNRLVYFYETA